MRARSLQPARAGDVRVSRERPGNPCISGFQYRIEIYYEALLVGGPDGLTLDLKEVLEARLFSPADLPDGMPEAHREFAASL